MLRSIRIVNFVFIDEVEIDFRPGFSVISGDSGAGKSIVFHGLNLLFTKRNKGLVRPDGGRPTIVSLRLVAGDREAAEGIAAICGVEAGSEAEGDLEFLLEKAVDPSGRSRITVNGVVVNQKALEQLYAVFFIICNQRQQSYFLNQENHLHIIDIFAGTVVLAAEMERIWLEGSQMRKEIAGLKEQLSSAKYSKEQLLEMLAEVEELATDEAEEGELMVRRRSLQTVDHARNFLSKAIDLIEGDGDRSAVGQLNQALRQLRRVGEAVDEYGAIGEGCLLDLQDLAARLSERLAEAENVEVELGRIDRRLELLRDTANRYSLLNPAMLPGAALQARERLEAFALIEATIVEKQGNLRQLEAAYVELAGEVSRQRRAAIITMEGRMAAEMDKLSLGHMRFVIKVANGEGDAVASISNGGGSGSGGDGKSIRVGSSSGGESSGGGSGGDGRALLGGRKGFDALYFSFERRHNVATTLTASTREISGGELSRITLALYSILAMHNSHAVMIFDEVDTGVSGHLATAIGRCLQDLASHKQVIAVTHLPQVGAHADHHLRVWGSSDEHGAYRVRVQQLNPGERVAEIGRMLAGKQIGEAALAAASQLIDDAVRMHGGG